MSTRREVPVRAAMSAPVLGPDADISLRAAARVMWVNQMSVLPLGGPAGLPRIVSERDVVHALAEGAHPDLTLVGDVASVEPLSVGPNTSLRAAVNLMHEVGIRHVPVVEHGIVVGMLSLLDALAACSGPARTMSEAARMDADRPPRRWMTPTGDPCPRSLRVDGRVEGTGDCQGCGCCLLSTGLVELQQPVG